MTDQEYMDHVAKENGWEVAESSSSASVYKRLNDTVVLEFDEGDFTGGEHIREIKIEGKVWKGHVSNILRKRFRTLTHE